MQPIMQASLFLTLHVSDLEAWTIPKENHNSRQEETIEVTTSAIIACPPLTDHIIVYMYIRPITKY